ncbi:hypothetical protein ACOSOMT5_P1093 [Acidiphilium sp. MT5]
MTLTYRRAEPADQAAWDEFVNAHPEATFFHRFAWGEVLATGFGHRPHFLLAERDRQICGVLPLMQVKTLLFGHSLISLPFTVYGGPLAADTETLHGLADAAIALQRTLGAPVCELRARTPLDLDPAQFAAPEPLYFTFRKTLPSTEEDALKAIPRKQRAVVRKAIEHGLTSEIERSIEPFFALYAESVHHLGTPVFSRRYVRALFQGFGQDVEVLTVRQVEKPLCAVLSFKFRDEILPYYAGGGLAARGVGGHDFMYWALMRHAISQGRTGFDFGRSKAGTGAFSFKKNWGFAPEPLAYRFALAPGARIPENNPLNPKYRALIALWKRLPRPIVNQIGPAIIRGLG